MNVNAVFPVVMTERLAESRDFYAELLGMRLAFESDWYVQLLSPATPAAQLGLVESGHESVPPVFRRAAAGVLVTVEVDDADAVHERAQAAGLPIELSLRDEEWGQRHFITRDPNGLAVDVVELIPVSSDEFAAQYAPDQLPGRA
jgi:catechol 2,3-dioxygenase-like lactoylglutathione lyase family enzyme